MLKSMTGFGKANADIDGKLLTVEVRSVNSKQLDLNLRLPNCYKDKENEIRTEAGKLVERGKVDISVAYENGGLAKPIEINRALVKSYYNELKSLADELNVPGENLLDTVLKLQEVFKTEKQVVTEEEWAKVKQAVLQAIEAFNNFRLSEGKSLQEELVARVELILNLLTKVEGMETGRMDNIRKRISGNLQEFIGSGKIDHNRLEQEMIYYLEKIDITEEKVRLRTHCLYFLETMKNDNSPGRKLGFIAQEIGREINTIGSKANDAIIQRHVVEMKDELEKIREQMLNVL